MKARIDLTPLILIVANLCALHGVARADAVTYSSSRQQIRAAVLVTSAPSGLANLHPYVFYVLDSRTGLKPAGIEFVNPQAPYAITSDIYASWQTRPSGSGDPAFTSGTPQYDLFQIGSRLTKKLGAYWEMNLDAMSPDDMRQYDVLYMTSVTANTVFTPDERSKLLRFVDGGGTLWFEVGGSFANPADGPFMVPIPYVSGGTFGLPAFIAPGSENHPLLSRPFRLDAKGISTLRSDGTLNLASVAPTSLMPIINNGSGNAILAAAQIGAGRVVVTTRSAGTSISDFVGVTAADGNHFAVSGDNFYWPDEIADYTAAVDLRQQADLMLGYNIAMWSTANGTTNGDSRRSSGTGERVAPILEPTWASVAAGVPGAAVVGAPVIYRGCVFVVDSSLKLHCYNMKPGLDLDGDGDPDNGIPDYDLGYPYDEIWNFDLTTLSPPGLTGASTPTIVEGISTVNGPEALVVVTLSNSMTVAFDAFPRPGGPGTPYGTIGNLEWLTPPLGNFDTTKGPPPVPVFCGGVLFAAAYLGSPAFGRIVPIDPLTGGSPFLAVPAINYAIPQKDQNFGQIVSSLAAGAIRDSATGALDRVVYAYTPGANSNAPPGIRAFWFSTSGEPLTLVPGTATTFRGRSDRAWFTNAAGSAALLPKIYARYDAGGGAVYTQLVAPASGPTFLAGQFETVDLPASITFTGPSITKAPTDAGVSIYADYTLDWTLPAPTGPGDPLQVTARSSLQMPNPDLSGSNKATGAPAITSTDALVYGVDTSGTTAGSTTTPGRGSVVSALEQFPAPKIVVPWAFTMHNGFTMTVAGQSVSVPARLFQRDTTAGLTAGVAVKEVFFVGSPAYRNGIAYLTANAVLDDPSSTPVSVLCAFKTTPDLRLRLNTQIDPTATIRVWQRNVLSSQGDGARIDLSPLQYTVDRTSGLIRIQSLAPPGANIGNSASCSMPFVVQVGTSPEQIISGTSSDGRMIGPDGVDNLLWYAVIPQGGLPWLGVAALGPVAAGPSLQGDTIWLSFANGIASFDADPGSTDSSAATTGAQASVGPSGTQVGHLRWAWSHTGVTFSTAPVGAGNAVVAASPSGVYAFEDTRTMIADSKRVLEVNSAGEPVWIADSTAEVPIVPNAAALAGTPQWLNRVSLTKPSLVRAFGPNNLLIVDTGNNRVVRMARAGNVLWQASSLVDGKGLLRPGDPLTLSGPTDCEYWTETPPFVTTGLPANAATVDHYLIADAGNFRVIELISVYDAAGSPLVDRQVNFVSSTLSKLGKHYRYISADRVREVNSNLPASWQYDPNNPAVTLPANAVRQLTLSMVSNYRLVGNTATANQAFNAFGDVAESSGGSLVILNEAGTALAVVSSLRVPDTSAQGFHEQPIVNPTSFSRFVELVAGNPVSKYLLTDANGCYQLTSVNGSGVPLVDGNGNAVLSVEWMLSAQAYQQITGKRLQAASIRRLPSSAWNASWLGLRQYLIVNRFAGSDDPSVFTGSPSVGHPSSFQGEAFVVSPSNFVAGPWADQTAASLGYLPDYTWSGTTMVTNPLASVAWRVPSQRWNSFGFMRTIGDQAHGTSTSILEQPAYADRPL